MNQFTVVPNKPDPTLDELAEMHLQAKRMLDSAKAHLDLINEKIVQVVGTKDEGAFSLEGDFHKITTTQPLTRSVDAKLAKDIYQQLPRDLADGIFTWKPSLNLKLYRELAKYQPDYHALISKAVTTKPGKPAVAVKVVDRPEAA